MTWYGSKKDARVLGGRSIEVEDMVDTDCHMRDSKSKSMSSACIASAAIQEKAVCRLCVTQYAC